MELKIQIAKGNTKLGTIPTISLPPCKACRKDAPCKGECYALKAWRQYKETREAWTRNFTLAKKHRTSYFDQIASFFSKKKEKPSFFRWHSSGDILDQDYLEGMNSIAANNPGTKKLCFTKMYHLDYRKILSNLNVVFSIWPGFTAKGINKEMPRCYVRIPGKPDPRIPADARHCPGHCDSCGLCWTLKPGESVVIDLH